MSNDIIKSVIDGQCKEVLAKKAAWNVFHGELETNQLKPELKIQRS